MATGDDGRPRTARGRPTRPASVPSWPGPLPTVWIERELKTGRGGAFVPLSLLHSGCQDLAVLVWAQLRLWFDGTAGPTSYLALAAELGLDSGTPKAVEVRFSRAVAPLLGTWIIRERLTENQFTYRALVPPGSSARYAIVSRDVLQMIAATRHTTKVKPADIADFARWQLECGQRGWTADTTKAITERWNVTPATIRASRNRLVDLRLLEVVPRASRLSDIVWLKELYDPYWMVPATVSDEPSELAESGSDLSTMTPISSAATPKSLSG